MRTLAQGNQSQARQASGAASRKEKCFPKKELFAGWFNFKCAVWQKIVGAQKKRRDGGCKNEDYVKRWLSEAV